MLRHSRLLLSSSNSVGMCMSTSISVPSHYDVLEITPKATQSDIKKAYYRLTMMYHPDKNKTESAKEKFRSVSEAYEVLGNYKSRKLYDRGMMIGGRATASTHSNIKEDLKPQFYKGQTYQKPVCTSSSKVYNFDVWTREHYSRTMERTASRRKAYQNLVAEDLDEAQGNEKMIMSTIIVLIAAIAVISVRMAEENYDEVIEQSNSKISKSPVAPDLERSIKDDPQNR